MNQSEVEKINSLNYLTTVPRLKPFVGFQLKSKDRSFALCKITLDSERHKVLVIEIVIGIDGRHREIDSRYQVTHIVSIRGNQITLEIVGKHVLFEKYFPLDRKFKIVKKKPR